MPQEAIDDARELAVRLALDPSDRSLDLRTFARALCLRANASMVCGITLEPKDILRVLSWFDRWSTIISRQLALIALPPVPFGPARQLRGLLREWYPFLEAAVDQGGEGLAGALREQLDAGEVTREEAAGYLATILFAGTEPPAQTLLWGYTQAIACGQRWAGIEAERAEELLWEAFRVQPAVNYLIRRLSAGDRRYESASGDVYVVAPPLTHRHTNFERGLPATFTPELPASGHLDPYEYPGLGTGAHYCLGAKLGMALTRDALAFLLNEADARGPWDAASAGRVMARPRRLPTAILR
jgi:cytochrome P450